MNHYAFIVSTSEYDRLRKLTTLTKLGSGMYLATGSTLVVVTTNDPSQLTTALVNDGDIVEFITH